MNFLIDVLHLLCTIGKKEGRYIYWDLHGKRRSGNGWRIKMKRKCFHLLSTIARRAG